MAYFTPEQYVSLSLQCLDEVDGHYLRSVDYAKGNQRIRINSVSHNKQVNTAYGFISFSIEFEIIVMDQNNRVLEWYVQICEFSSPGVRIVHLDMLKHAFLEGNQATTHVDRFMEGFNKLFDMPTNK